MSRRILSSVLTSFSRRQELAYTAASSEASHLSQRHLHSLPCSAGAPPHGCGDGAWSGATRSVLFSHQTAACSSSFWTGRTHGSDRRATPAAPSPSLLLFRGLSSLPPLSPHRTLVQHRSSPLLASLQPSQPRHSEPAVRDALTLTRAAAAAPTALQQLSSTRTYFSNGGSSSLPYWLRRVLENGAPYTNALIALNVGAFLAQKMLPGFTVKFALVNGLVAMNGEYWRLFSAAFLHTGFIHMAVNMYTLYILAPNIERVSGSRRFLVVYMLSAFSGNALQYFMTPMGGVSMGASSALAGMFGSFIVYKYVNRTFVGFGQEDVSWIAQVVGLNLLMSMGGGNIGHWAHLGGLLGGSAAMWALGPRYMWSRGGKVDRPLVPLPRWLVGP